MKELHLSGEPRKMTVSEILEECQSQSTGEFSKKSESSFSNWFSVTNSTKQALEVALRENAKLRCEEIKGICRFAFRPPIGKIISRCTDIHFTLRGNNKQKRVLEVYNKLLQRWSRWAYEGTVLFIS